LRKSFYLIAVFTLSLLAFSSCVSLTGFQDGRTLEDGVTEIAGSINATQVPDTETHFDDDIITAGTVYPNIELAMKHGINEKWEIGGKITTSFSAYFTSKYQVYGDKQSKYAMAIGPELGTNVLLPGLINLQLPFYMSMHPSERTSLYTTPRYIIQFSGYGSGGLKQIHYIGNNLGVLLGSRHKFGIDLGYYRAIDSPNTFNSGLLQVGVAGKFRFGGKYRKEALKEDKPTRRKG
jgi:hypothetical protein